MVVHAVLEPYEPFIFLKNSILKAGSVEAIKFIKTFVFSI